MNSFIETRVIAALYMDVLVQSFDTEIHLISKSDWIIQGSIHSRQCNDIVRLW